MLSNPREIGLAMSLMAAGELSPFMAWLKDGEQTASDATRTCPLSELPDRRAYWRALYEITQAIQTAPELARKLKEN